MGTMKTEHPPYVTIAKGMRGYFAVLMSWNTEHDGFYEPYWSGSSSFETRAAAIPAARAMAAAEDVAFRERG